METAGTLTKMNIETSISTQMETPEMAHDIFDNSSNVKKEYSQQAILV